MDTQTFRKTRIILTAWYTTILAIILFSFSFVLYMNEQHDFIRIIVRRDFNSSVPRTLNTEEQGELENQLVAIRSAFLFNLISIDILVLLLGGGLSYFLAGKTLSPIQETFAKQKQFLADVSHEIRTPLAAIQTAAEVSLRGKEKSKMDYKNVLEQVHSESKRLTKMANDLLVLSRMESKTMQKMNTVSLSKITKEVVDTFLPAASAKHISLKIHKDEHVSVVGDKDGLLQLVMIFLDNAIKYTKEKGSIKIFLKKEPRPSLVIQDTGIGISEKDIKRIFERFYQADVSRSSLGNGLGLAIAKEIILSHKAKVSVESKIGTGTTFTIVFPES